MKLPLPSDFFAPVRLSAREARELQLVEAGLLERYLRSYEEFSHATREDAADRYQRRRRRRGDLVETSGGKWAFVRQHHGLRVYRKHAVHHRRQYQFQHYRSREPHELEHECLAEVAKTRKPAAGRADARHRHADHSRLAGALVVGTAAGALEDFLYGAMWASGDERVARAWSARDGVADAAVLHAIERPSPMDPWRSLAVKWSLRRAPPLGASLLVKDRDFCYLAASGVVQTRDGARVGYRLRHSMAFPSCPPFQNRSVVRGQIFCCSLFRQLQRGGVEVFHQASYDAGGGLLRALAERAVVATLLDYARLPQVACAKKLAHAVRLADCARCSRAPALGSLLGSTDDVDRDSCCAAACGVCLDALPRSGDRERCAVCRHGVCASCSVRKEVEARSAARGRASARRLCKPCVARVERDDATMYAVRDAGLAEQARQRDAPRRRKHRSLLGGSNGSDSSSDNAGPSRWGHDDIDDEFPSALAARQHSVTLFAPDECTFEVDEQGMAPSRRHRHRRRHSIAGVAVATAVGAAAPAIEWRLPSAGRQASVPELSAAPPSPFRLAEDGEEEEEEAPEASTPSTVAGNAIGLAWGSRGRSATAPLVPSASTSAADPASDGGGDVDVRGGEDAAGAAQPRLLRAQSLYAANAPPILLRSDVGKRNWRASMSALSLASSFSTDSDGDGNGGGGGDHGVRIPAPSRRQHRQSRHRHRHRRSSSSSSHGARCSSFSSTSSAGSTVLVSLSSRGLPPKKHVNFRDPAPARARLQAQRRSPHP